MHFELQASIWMQVDGSEVQVSILMQVGAFEL